MKLDFQKYIKKYDFYSYFIQTMLGNALKFFSLFILLAGLNHKDWSRWLYLSTIVSYFTFLNFGTTSLLNKFGVSLFEEQKWERLSSLLKLNLLTNLLSLLFFAMFCLIYNINKGGLTLPFGFSLLYFFAFQVFSTGMTILRIKSDFSKVGLFSLISGVFSLVSALIAIKTGLLNVFIAGQSLSLIIALIPLFHFNRAMPKLRMNVKLNESILLLREGVLLVASGLIFALLTTMDRWFLVSNSPGAKIYLRLVIINIALMLVNQVVSQYYYNQIAVAKNPNSTKKIIVNQNLVGGIISLLALGFFVVLGNVFNKYYYSLNGYQLIWPIYMSAGTLIYSFHIGYANLLLSHLKMTRYLTIQIFTTALYTILLFILQNRFNLDWRYLALINFIVLSVYSLALKIGGSAAEDRRESYG